MTGATANSTALFRLDGEVAIVTGAGAGLGHAIAALLADAGASVVAADMDAELAQRTAAIIAGSKPGPRSITSSTRSAPAVRATNRTAAGETSSALSMTLPIT